MITALAIFLAAPAFAYECDLDKTAQNALRFDDNQDGTLTDIASGLTWMRCSLGQIWENNSCTGEPRLFTWQAALEAAQKLNANGGYADSTEWRVPGLPELATITERFCKDPRINLTLFPKTPAEFYWSSDTKPQMFDRGYAMGFEDSGVVPQLKSNQYHVRLVHGERGRR